MRDILTALAGAVILLLVAALAVPPLVDWTAQRAVVDRAVGRSLGMPVRSEGRLDVRLLPSPRLRIDRLHLGTEGGPSLDARFVKAELALPPLLKGEFRFTETRIGRAEVKVPVTAGEALLLPSDLPAALGTDDLAIEDLQIQQFLLTTTVPATGRTDQLYATDLRLQAPALRGPWRVEGASGGVPFRLTSGALEADGVAVKLSGGGDAHPRFEADARLSLGPAPARGGRPARTVQTEGTARLVIGPPSQEAGPFVPMALSGQFKGTGSQLRFDTVAAEIDPGGRPVRLSGSGRLDLRHWRAGLALEARRLDLDGFLAAPAGQALIARGLPRAGLGLPVLLDLDLAAESLALGGAEWSDLALAATLDRDGGLVLRGLRASAPGAAALAASGTFETVPAPRFTGPVSLSAPRSDGFGRYLRRLGLESPALALLDGRAVEAGADVSADAAAFSLRNLRLGLGPARITGNVRYAAPAPGTRGRFDAQIAARGLDIAALPPLGTAFSALEGHDLGLTLEARDTRYGEAGTGGTVAARIQSDGPSLVVDSLEVTNLAGANATLSGRISPDGAGRIEGRVQAPAAAPLVALLDRIWAGESRFVPDFLRAAPLDLGVTLAREAGAAETLRAAARGRAGGGDLDLALTRRAGRLERAEGRLATPQTGPWFGRGDLPALRAPASLTFQATRTGDGGLAVRGEAVLAALRLATTSLVLAAEDARPVSGEVRAEGGDIAPFLALAGAGGLAPGAWPAALTVTFGRQGEDLRAAVSGQVSGAALDAQAVLGGDGSVGGSATLARLALPQLAAALLPAEGGPARPAPLRPHGPVRLDVRAAALELGPGLTASGAAFRLALEDGTLGLRDLTARLAEGRLDGSATLARRGGALAISGEGGLADAAIPALADGSPLSGRLSAKLRFGTSGVNAGALAANLAGSGTLALADLAVPEADPAALGRALARALEMEDPLREGRLPQIVGEELGRAAAQARGTVTAPLTIVGGVLRAGPLDLDLGPARWSGSVAYDLRAGRLDARGQLAGGAPPRGWSAGTPAVQLGLSGPMGAPERSLDTGALATGLAAVVLQRELERIELLEADQSERQRRRARIEMDRARAAALKAADEAARQEAARLEAARQETARQEAARQEAARQEAARQARLKAQAAEEAARQEAARQEALRQEALRQEAARQDAARRSSEADAPERSAPEPAPQP